MCITCGHEDWAKLIAIEKEQHQIMLDLRAHQVVENALKDRPVRSGPQEGP